VANTSDDPAIAAATGEPVAERAGQPDQAGDQREPEHQLLVDARAERRDHRRHGQAEAEQAVDDQR